MKSAQRQSTVIQVFWSVVKSRRVDSGGEEINTLRFSTEAGGGADDDEQWEIARYVMLLRFQISVSEVQTYSPGGQCFHSPLGLKINGTFIAAGSRT